MTKTEILNLQIRAYLGLPYIWGGDDPIKGFDCSGFVLELLKSIGEWPNKQDTTSLGLKNYFQAKSATGQTPKFGSLLFFGKSPAEITHIAFALSDKCMVEAGGGGSSTVDQKSAIDQNAYVRIRPIKNRSDLQAIHHLNLEG